MKANSPSPGCVSITKDSRFYSQACRLTPHGWINRFSWRTNFPAAWHLDNLSLMWRKPIGCLLLILPKLFSSTSVTKVRCCFPQAVSWRFTATHWWLLVCFQSSLGRKLVVIFETWKMDTLICMLLWPCAFFPALCLRVQHRIRSETTV